MFLLFLLIIPLAIGPFQIAISLVFIVIFGYIFWRLIKYIVESFKPKD